MKDCAFGAYLRTSGDGRGGGLDVVESMLPLGSRDVAAALRDKIDKYRKGRSVLLMMSRWFASFGVPSS